MHYIYYTATFYLRVLVASLIIPIVLFLQRVCSEKQHPWQVQYFLQTTIPLCMSQTHKLLLCTSTAVDNYADY